MRGYICQVAAVAIIVALTDVLIPKNWQKYISILTSAMLLITLTSPLLNLRGIAMPDFSLPEGEYREYSLESEVATTLKQEVEKDIKKRLAREFNAASDAEVTLNIKDEKIAGVEKIILYADENAQITARLREVYGCNNIIWR